MQGTQACRQEFWCTVNPCCWYVDGHHHNHNHLPTPLQGCDLSSEYVSSEEEDGEGDDRLPQVRTSSGRCLKVVAAAEPIFTAQ